MFADNHVPNRILVIDDDSSQIMQLYEVLKAFGKLFFQQDSRKALDDAFNKKPSIILLDIQMPHFDGYEILSQLKSHPATAVIPVIFITSNNSPEEQLQCLNAGAVDFISKPLHPAVVAARVKAQLSLRHHQQQLQSVYEQTKVTLQSIGDAVITTDKTGCVTYMNPAAELMTGLTFNDAENREIEDVMPLRIGDNGPPHINPIRIALKENRAVGMALNCKMKTQCGRWIAVEDSASPLVNEDGEISGAVIVFKDIDESRAMALQMSHALQHDQLTNLPNRFLMLEHTKLEIQRSKRRRFKLGILLVDINRFKLINEEFGFEFGDVLLQKIASTIQEQLLKDEKLSRHNADQFMVLVPQIEQPSDLLNRAMLLKDSIFKFVGFHPEISNFSLSIGLSIYPDDATDPQSLMLHADAALHKAKKSGKHEGVCFYSEDMESHFLSRREYYRDLKNAVSNNRVVALYQPMINSQTGKVESIEALVRIKNDNGDLISPIHFIDLAEDTRLIIPLGELMLKLVFAQLSKWQKTGMNVCICINISPIQFADPHFIPFLIDAMRQYKIKPNLVELEVTEGLMLENSEQMIDDMIQLRKMGISISIDDFGTGYSCLSYLKNLPVDVLKIDKSFISTLCQDESNEALVQTIVSLAKSLNLKSVAEGVETKEQALKLKSLGVTLLQGYLFSRPESAKNIRKEYSYE